MVWSLNHIAILEGEFADFLDLEDIYNTVMAAICVLCAGLAAGLTIGLLSLDKTKLEIKTLTGTPEEIAAAEKVLPLIKRHHLLLVSILLFNSVANESLPVFLGALVPNYLAVIISVSLVLVCGEIIPSAMFTGAGQLKLVSSLTKTVWGIIFILYPIAYPISLVLDYIFGEEEESTNMTRKELEALMMLQSPERKKSVSSRKDEEGSAPLLNKQKSSDNLSHDEIDIMTGVLRLSKIRVVDCMISIGEVYMLSAESILDAACLRRILNNGYSRIPVYKNGNIQCVIGILLTKSLIVVNPTQGLKVTEMSLREPVFVRPDQGLLEVLNIFQEGHSHMALVSQDPELTKKLFCARQPQTSISAILGIVTLEDILEKILQEEIYDESDLTRCRASMSISSDDGVSLLTHNNSKTVPNMVKLAGIKKWTTHATEKELLLDDICVHKNYKALVSPTKPAKSDSNLVGLRTEYGAREDDYI